MQNLSKIIDWLLLGDPAIRFQVHRDLLKSPKDIIEKEQKAISCKGWGKHFLDLQDEAGTWGGGLYTPKWISTFYTLQTLMQLGMLTNPNVEKAIRLILDKGYSNDGGINLWHLPQSETCVTGMFLAIVCHFELKDERIHGLADNLLGIQMTDGGWNCRKPRGAVHSSFHTTISALEGLWEYEKRTAGKRKTSINNGRKRAIEFLLQHQLFRSHRTGRIFDSKITRFSFPPRWHYDVMRGLDHLRDCNYNKDKRMIEAIELIRSKQEQNGFWKLQQNHSGKVFFNMEIPAEPSRWNTFRALRILDWWEK